MSDNLKKDCERKANEYLLLISNGNGPVVTVGLDGTVKVYQEGSDKEAARIFYESLQFEGKTLFQQINELKQDCQSVTQERDTEIKRARVAEARIEELTKKNQQLRVEKP